ncbi:MAG: hypothetical protein NC548_18435 [Lachnospiraceae bacterium]|nr:hypothetical protein [Lachnospiraceae bacterium]
MSDTKIFSFPDGGTSGGNTIAAMLPALLQNRGVDSGYLMGMLNGRGGNGGFFGNNGGFQDIIALIVIAAIFGNGNGGGIFGGGGNNGTEAREMIMQTLNRNGIDIAAIAQAVNTSSDQIMAGINTVSQAICGLGNQLGQNTNSIITALLQGNNALTSQIASCCCDLKGVIANLGTGMERGFSSLAFESERQTCALKGAISDSTEKILAGQRAAEMREMQDKLDKLREENSTYKTSAMTSQIVGQATAPLGAALGDLSARLAKIECNQPEVAKVPYSPVVGVPTCVAAQFGLGLGLNGFGLGNGFWG